MYGDLLVIQELEVGGFACQCVCGGLKVCLGNVLTSGRNISCGCRAGGRLSDGEASFRRVRWEYRSGAKARGLVFELSDDIFRALVTSPCDYCGDPPAVIKVLGSPPSTFVHGGIDRIDNTKGYIEGNVVPCCRRCNVGKWDYHRDEFLSWVRRVHQKSCV
jgi:hypothetical protein